MTVSQVVMVPCFLSVLLSRPIFFFSYFCRCESALAINIVMTSGEGVSKEGHGGGQAMVTSKPMVVYGQVWLVVGGDVGSELKDRLNGRACRSDSRWMSQRLVLTRAVDAQPWKGEVQGWWWWQRRHRLSYGRLFC
jgi:hypothetical protein